MKRILRTMWAISLGLIMILSSTVMNVHSGSTPDIEIQAAPVQLTNIIDYDPWPTHSGTYYHTIPEMETELFWIAGNYPQITKLVSIGKTWQGRDIWAMKVSDNPHIEEDEPEVYFNANHHAREWMTIEIALYSLRYLTNFYGTDPTVTELVNTRQIWIIPSANPDGRAYDSAGDNPASHVQQPYGWRKNCRDNDNSGTFNEAYDGVDLNRNYGYLWGASGASADPNYLTYGGPYPFSEPETAAIRDFCRQHDFQLAISFHTSSQLILYPWGWAFETTPDNDALIAVGQEMQKVMTNTAGSVSSPYTLQQSVGLYPTAGSDDDWLYGELGIFAYCIEAYPSQFDSSDDVSDPYDSFHPRDDKVLPVCKDNLPAVLLFCQIADNKNQFIDHVDIEPEESQITIEDDTSGNVALTVTDDGRRADTFTLAATGVPGWSVNLDQNVVGLARNETRSVNLNIAVPLDYTPGTYSIWVNVTSQTNSSCKDSSLVQVTVPYPEDAAAIGLLPFTEMGSFPKGAYRMDGTVRNVGEVAVPAFTTSLTIKELGVGGTDTLFQENFETGLGQWTIIDHDKAESASVWKTSTTQEHLGSYSAWCGSTTQYALNTVQSLQMTQPISLKRHNSATLTFWGYYSTQLYYDFLMVEGSADNGQSWDFLARYHGPGTPWTQYNINLAQFLGSEQFKLRFRFTSNNDGVLGTGFYLDDVLITAVNPTEALRYGPVNISTSEVLDVGEMKELSWYYNFTYPGTFLASVTTKCPNDSNPANNVSDVMFLIDNRNMPIFSGVKSVEDTGGGSILTLKWDPALQVNDPIMYKVYRFDHTPSQAEVNASTPVWTGTTVGTVDSGLTPGNTYYYVVRAQDALGQKEYNMVVKSATTTITNPLFDGIEYVFNSGTGESLDISWEQAFDLDWPITYRVYRFDHDPTNLEIDNAIQAGSATELIYRDSGLSEGVTYWYAVRAYDAGGNHDSNYVRMSGTPSFAWYLQEGGALNNWPMDGPGTATTGDLTSATEFQAGVGWTSDAFPQAADIAGAWTFNVYGHALNANANGFLYAKVYRTSDSQLLWTTGYDDEDIAGLPATHLFAWTGTAPSAVIGVGDSVKVEFWVHVTSVSIPANGYSPNPDFTFNADGWTGAAWSALGGTNYVTENWDPAGFINVTFAGPTTGQTTYTRGGYWQCPFTVGYTPSASTLSFYWRCSQYTGIGGPMVFYAFVDTVPGEPVQGTQVWSSSTSLATAWAPVYDIDISAIIDAPGTYYLKVATSVTQLGRNDVGIGAFDGVSVSWSSVPSSMSLAYDSYETPSWVTPTISPTSVGQYDIDLTGFVAGQWAFVSFPVQASGHIESVLNDTTLGDGQTSWDVAKTWDNLNKKWLTYRKSGTQTFTQVNNQMGVWLHLTGNDGDQNLTLGVAGNYPSSAVEIQLYAGWNMVGYPSAIGSAALPAEAAMISEWQSASPYIVDKAPGAVTMSHGNGYWIKVTVDCTWTVEP